MRVGRQFQPFGHEQTRLVPVLALCNEALDFLDDGIGMAGDLFHRALALLEVIGCSIWKRVMSTGRVRTFFFPDNEFAGLQQSPLVRPSFRP